MFLIYKTVVLPPREGSTHTSTVTSGRCLGVPNLGQTLYSHSFALPSPRSGRQKRLILSLSATDFSAGSLWEL